jgi:hypothetical protein
MEVHSNTQSLHDGVMRAAGREDFIKQFFSQFKDNLDENMVCFFPLFPPLDLFAFLLLTSQDSDEQEEEDQFPGSFFFRKVDVTPSVEDHSVPFLQGVTDTLQEMAPRRLSSEIVSSFFRDFIEGPYASQLKFRRPSAENVAVILKVCFSLHEVEHFFHLLTHRSLWTRRCHRAERPSRMCRVFSTRLFPNSARP